MCIGEKGKKPFWFEFLSLYLSVGRLAKLLSIVINHPPASKSGYLTTCISQQVFNPPLVSLTTLLTLANLATLKTVTKLASVREGG